MEDSKGIIVLKYPTHVIWHILKEKLTYTEIRVLHAVISYINKVPRAHYDSSIVDKKERINKSIPIQGCIYNEDRFKKHCTAKYLRKLNKYKEGLSSLQLKNFVNIAHSDDNSSILLTDSRKPYRRIPFSIIELCAGKNTLPFKLVIWLCAISKKSMMDRHGNFNYQISVDSFVNNYFYCFKDVSIFHVNEKIREAMVILHKNNKDISYFVDETKQLNFIWKPIFQSFKNPVNFF
jgi:hypothetical protein